MNAETSIRQRAAEWLECWASAATTEERERATSALVAILPLLEPSVGSGFSRHQLSILNGVLRDADRLAWPTHRDVEFVVGVVQAVAKVGDETAVSLLWKLALDCRQREVKESASCWLPVLEQRVARGRGRGSLLSPAVTLLRSARPKEADDLLRPVTPKIGE